MQMVSAHSSNELQTSYLKAAAALDRGDSQAALDALIDAPLIPVEGIFLSVALSVWKGVVRSHYGHGQVDRGDVEAVCSAPDEIAGASEAGASHLARPPEDPIH
uniref:Uncharacterized protein n=1 Tax=Candidatus Kentrum sp. FW TaxID=2126338 RepID=A0A450TY58_9GAMM|nr:MAG: hypothetical protein BECKFW1821C_GA0114237_106321 [Candidatus Kentron sp. FW]